MHQDNNRDDSGLTADGHTSLALSDRIRTVLDRYEYRKKAAEVAGISVDQLNAYVKGRNAPGFMVMAKLAAGAGVNLDWLATGNGRMLLDEVGEQEALYGSDLLEVRAADGDPPGGDGGGSIDRIGFPRAWIAGTLKAAAADLLLVTASGDSMAPHITDGDVLVVDTSRQDARQEGIYVLELDGQLHPKRLQAAWDGSMLVKSDNAAYDSQRVPREDVARLRIVGRVVWIGRRA